jgi:hypothetical protein
MYSPQRRGTKTRAGRALRRDSRASVPGRPKRRSTPHAAAACGALTELEGSRPPGPGTRRNLAGAVECGKQGAQRLRPLQIDSRALDFRSLRPDRRRRDRVAPGTDTHVRQVRRGERHRVAADLDVDVWHLHLDLPILGPRAGGEGRHDGSERGAQRRLYSGARQRNPPGKWVRSETGATSGPSSPPRALVPES